MSLAPACDPDSRTSDGDDNGWIEQLDGEQGTAAPPPSDAGIGGGTGTVGNKGKRLSGDDQSQNVFSGSRVAYFLESFSCFSYFPPPPPPPFPFRNDYQKPIVVPPKRERIIGPQPLLSGCLHHSERRRQTARIKAELERCRRTVQDASPAHLHTAYTSFCARLDDPYLPNVRQRYLRESVDYLCFAMEHTQNALDELQLCVSDRRVYEEAHLLPIFAAVASFRAGDTDPIEVPYPLPLERNLLPPLVPRYDELRVSGATHRDEPLFVWFGNGPVVTANTIRHEFATMELDNDDMYTVLDEIIQTRKRVMGSLRVRLVEDLQSLDEEIRHLPARDEMRDALEEMIEIIRDRLVALAAAAPAPSSGA
ncbi:hypothetical protein CC85DRAFT_293827 [Cutaneotrichosporon oleaginosum]|uniref:Uncharacterized protein n=1 Tax=Cutaneotrichosporon oleaginosum TaxID=879819 RepID=A0A0J0XED1_9TREE|nr:uncharacterized protein CC85DRAFT_293827 [Cutaneotrichosporon oleaginosum]KLT39426.1 hypothetical protein CC85DRAFT_293827 [Cutaneotrichosporon oleaginosum]